ncbi:MAG TPA: monovalent cation/H(+) antiporter subunit G [Bauldia sp.]|nr:monovalent cation/H(+) antiporter subunit G [Bauldia sp.]
MTAALVLEWLGGGLAVAGALLMVVSGIGLNRMPDVFTRLHAASVGDTLGVALVLVGLMFYGGLTLVTVKLAFLVLFLALVGPVATHAVARAALLAGVVPVGRDGRPLPRPDLPAKAARAPAKPKSAKKAATKPAGPKGAAKTKKGGGSSKR